MRRVTETIYERPAGGEPLLVVREGLPVQLGSPRTPSEAHAMAVALLDAVRASGPLAVVAAPEPRQRHAWLADDGRKMVDVDNGEIRVHAYDIGPDVAAELAAALLEAVPLTTPPKEAA